MLTPVIKPNNHALDLNIIEPAETSVVDGFVDDFMTDFEDLFVDSLLNTWSNREIEHAYKSQRLFEANMDRIIEGDCYKYEINNLS